MTGRVYRDYQRDRVGWFFGLTGVQLGLLGAGALPVFSTARIGWWSAAFVSLVAWVVLFTLVVVPVRGLSVVGWAIAWSRYGTRVVLGRTCWSSPLAFGRTGELDLPDLPAPLHLLRVHHAPKTEETLHARDRGAGPGIVQDPARGTWTLTARLEHDGLDWLTAAERDQHGAGLAALLDGACRTEMVSEVQILVRASPDDGAERQQWLASHRESVANGGKAEPATTAAAATSLSRRVHDDLRRYLTPAASRVETFLVVVVPETNLRRQARAARRGTSSRRSSTPASASGTPFNHDDVSARLGLLAAIAAEVGQQAKAFLGASVDWLDPAALAQACREGFHPDASAVLTDARGTPTTGTDENDAGVPWAAAGPARAVVTPYAYGHDRWRSASVSVLLPPRGAILGALSPVLSADVAGERRCLLVAFPVVTATAADRITASREWAADLGDGLRARAGVRSRAKARADQATARGVDAKLVAGAALCRPYAIATTSVPVEDGSASTAVADAVRRLEVSVRRAGFAAQRLDLAHDGAFAAGCLPLGHSLAPIGSRR